MECNERLVAKMENGLENPFNNIRRGLENLRSIKGKVGSYTRSCEPVLRRITVNE